MNGLKIQWGKWDESKHSSGERHILFPVAYSNASSIAINLTNIYGGSSKNEFIIVRQVTTTYCYFDSDLNRDVFWQSIGY